MAGSPSFDGSDEEASSQTGPTRERLVGAAIHACQILECFSIARPELTLTEVVRELGLSKPSVYRLLQTLVGTGFLTFNEATFIYQLGSKSGKLGEVYRSKFSLIELVRPYLMKIRDKTGESVALQVRDGEVRGVALEVPSMQGIRMLMPPDSDVPLTRGAAGQILKAFSSEVGTGDAKESRIRSDGYAISRGEVIPDSVAVYVPVLSTDGLCVGTIGVYGPAFRISESDAVRFAQQLMAAASEIGEGVPVGPPS